MTVTSTAVRPWQDCIDVAAFVAPAGNSEVCEYSVTALDAQLLKAAIDYGNFSSWPVPNWSPAATVECAIPEIFASNRTCFNLFNQDWLANLVPAFAARGVEAAADLEEFLSTGTSDGLQIYSSTLLLAANGDFGTHIHGTLEYMLVVGGAIEEMRLVNADGGTDRLLAFTPAQLAQGMNATVHLPLVPQEASARFIYSGAGGSEVNGIGSCHASRSGGAGLALVGFYGGFKSHVGLDRQLAWNSSV